MEKTERQSDKTRKLIFELIKNLPNAISPEEKYNDWENLLNLIYDYGFQNYCEGLDKMTEVARDRERK